MNDRVKSFFGREPIRASLQASVLACASGLLVIVGLATGAGTPSSRIGVWLYSAAGAALAITAILALVAWLVFSALAFIKSGWRGAWTLFGLPFVLIVWAAGYVLYGVYKFYNP